MKTNWNFLKAGALVIALPLMATAAVSASQWVNDTTPIQLDIEAPVAKATAINAARAHTVALSDNGAIEGRVAAVNAEGAAGLSNLNVYFMRNGRVVQEAITAADGSFRVEGLNKGNYSFVASGEKGFAAYGVRVVGPSKDINNVMEAAAVGKGVSTVKQLLEENASEVPGSQFTAVENTGSLVGANRVNLVDGILSGSVNSLVGANVEGSQVFILNGEAKVAEVKTDAKGNFEVANMKPGFYNFVTTGPSGYAAIGFEAISKPVVEIPVSMTPASLQEVGFGNTLDIYTTTNSDAAYTGEIVYNSAEPYQEFAPIEYASESIGVGGSCGGACGSCSNYCGGGLAGGFGGGGLGGGGGLLRGGAGLGRLGRLALLGGAVVGIVAIADDNDAGAASPDGN